MPSRSSDRSLLIGVPPLMRIAPWPAECTIYLHMDALIPGPHLSWLPLQSRMCPGSDVLDARIALGFLAFVRGESFIVADFIGGLKLKIFVAGDSNYT
jgi:hypothetical protein